MLALPDLGCALLCPDFPTVYMGKQETFAGCPALMSLGKFQQATGQIAVKVEEGWLFKILREVASAFDVTDGLYSGP